MITRIRETLWALGVLLTIYATDLAANPPTTPAATDQQADDTLAAKDYRRPVYHADNGISDPTRINESFRDVLERRMPARGVPEGTAAPAAPALPDISLAASLCGHGKDSMRAMLRINDKVQLVRPGDKITLVENRGVVEIQVLEIHRHRVHLRVLPADEELILH